MSIIADDSAAGHHGKKKKNIKSLVLSTFDNMHGDLSAHLHTDECNRLIQALQKCHIENPYGKFFGKCNEQNALMDRCLAQEREDNRRKNREKTQDKRKKMQEALQAKKAEGNVR